MLPLSRRIVGRRLPCLASRAATASLSRPALFSTTARPLANLATDTAKAPSKNDQFATGNNAYYAEEMYRLWKSVSGIVAEARRG